MVFDLERYFFFPEKAKEITKALSLSLGREGRRREREREKERVDFVRTASRAMYIYLISPFPRVIARVFLFLLLRFLLVFLLFARPLRKRETVKK